MAFEHKRQIPTKCFWGLTTTQFSTPQTDFWKIMFGLHKFKNATLHITNAVPSTVVLKNRIRPIYTSLVTTTTNQPNSRSNFYTTHPLTFCSGNSNPYSSSTSSQSSIIESNLEPSYTFIHRVCPIAHAETLVQNGGPIPMGDQKLQKLPAIKWLWISLCMRDPPKTPC